MGLSLAGSGEISGFDAGLSGFGGLVVVKSALFTGTQTNSTAGGGNFAVTDLSITHEVADASNVLLFIVSIGQLSIDLDYWPVAAALAVDGTLFNIADAASNRTRAAAGARFRGLDTGVATNAGPVAFSTAYTPGTGSKVYTVRAINTDASTKTIHVNRNGTDADFSVHTRSVSSLIMLEVKV